MKWYPTAKHTKDRSPSKNRFSANTHIGMNFSSHDPPLKKQTIGLNKQYSHLDQLKTAMHSSEISYRKGYGSLVSKQKLLHLSWKISTCQQILHICTIHYVVFTNFPLLLEKAFTVEFFYQKPIVKYERRQNKTLNILLSNINRNKKKYLIFLLYKTNFRATHILNERQTVELLTIVSKIFLQISIYNKIIPHLKESFRELQRKFNNYKTQDFI